MLLRPGQQTYVTLQQRLRSRVGSLAYSTRNISNERQLWGKRKYGIALVGGVATTFSVAVWWYYSRSSSLTKLDRVKFVTTTVQELETSGPNSKLIRVRLPPELFPENVNNALRPMWALNFKNSDIQVERAYTPLEGISADGEMKFWIKKYDHGEMGRWLHERQQGETLEVRGPERSWDGLLDDYDHIVMIAGGTGVAPFYQLLHSIFTDESKKQKQKQTRMPRLTLLHSHRNHQTLPPDFIMTNLSSWAANNSDVLEVKTYVETSEGNNNMNSYREGRITREDLRQVLRSKGNGEMNLSRKVILVCGPDSMVAAFAGPRGRDLSQGPAGGVLASLGCKEHNIWKL